MSKKQESLIVNVTNVNLLNSISFIVICHKRRLETAITVQAIFIDNIYVYSQGCNTVEHKLAFC